MATYKFPHEGFQLQSVYDVFEMVRIRTAMYTGEGSLRSIRTFCAGVYEGMMNCGYVLRDDPEFGGFHDFVAEKLQCSESTAGWDNMILGSIVDAGSERVDFETLDQRASDTDHQNSLNIFYMLLEDYKKERQT